MPKIELLRDDDHANAWLLLVDGVPQSYVDLDDPTHLDFPYVQLIAAVIDAAFPSRTTDHDQSTSAAPG